jgi:hypothetical protein
MITNIIAAVVITLSTNIVPTDNAVWGRDWALMYPEGGGPSVIFKPATEQYLTTNVVENTKITVKLSDGPHTFYVDRTISSVTAILRKREQWEASGVKTNEIPTWGGTLTNVSFAGTNTIELNTIMKP